MCSSCTNSNCKVGNVFSKFSQYCSKTCRYGAMHFILFSPLPSFPLCEHFQLFFTKISFLHLVEWEKHREERERIFLLSTSSLSKPLQLLGPRLDDISSSEFLWGFPYGGRTHILQPTLAASQSLHEQESEMLNRTGSWVQTVENKWWTLQLISLQHQSPLSFFFGGGGLIPHFVFIFSFKVQTNPIWH